MSRTIESLTRNGSPGIRQADGQTDPPDGSRFRVMATDDGCAAPGDLEAAQETSAGVALAARAGHALAPLLFSAKDLAQVLNVSVETVWRMRAKGRLPRAFELSKQTLRWRVEEVNRWVQAGMPDLKTWDAMTKQAGGPARPG